MLTPGCSSEDVVQAPAERTEAAFCPSFPLLGFKEFSVLWESTGGNGKAYKHCPFNGHGGISVSSLPISYQ